MQRITVISGKGGTGKTTVVANLAALAEQAVLADCDVDAPNLHLLLKPSTSRERVFKGGKLAVKQEEQCKHCGRCLAVCRFAAITDHYRINPFKCEGCGVCVYICPTKALELQEQVTGTIYTSQSLYGPMIHARLKTGADNSGKLVSAVRKEAEQAAAENGRELLLIDGSPGIGCPVIASLNGVDLALIVTEPTRSGCSDLKRILAVAGHFSIPALVVINKDDLNQAISLEIEGYCQKGKWPVIGRIPFDPLVNQALHAGQLLVESYPESKPARAIKDIWTKLSNF